MATLIVGLLVYGVVFLGSPKFKGHVPMRTFHADSRVVVHTQAIDKDVSFLLSRHGNPAYDRVIAVRSLSEESVCVLNFYPQSHPGNLLVTVREIEWPIEDRKCLRTWFHWVRGEWTCFLAVILPE